MKNKTFNIKHLGILIATILILNLCGVTIVSVEADEGGTGKFLQINFEGTTGVFSNCSVTATKISSGQIFIFQADDPTTHRQKVGAGTVLLTAIADESNGWTFSHFDGDVTMLDDPNQALYKTEKNDVVTAYFNVITYTITPIAGEHGTMEPNLPVTVPYGGSQIFYFDADEGYHVSAVIIDGNYVALVPTSFTTQYTFDNVTDDHIIEVYFSLEGEAYVPSGSNVTVFLDSFASLNFIDGTSGGTAFGQQLFSFDPTDIIIWEITVVAEFDGQVIVALKYDPELVIGDENSLRLWTADTELLELFLKSDFNEDGIITGKDVKILANIVKNIKFWDEDDLELYDLSGDNVISEEDVHVVNSFNNQDLSDFLNNLEWTDITHPTLGVDIENNIIYGLTGHFSLFRCR